MIAAIVKHKQEMLENGFTIIENVFSTNQVAALINIIESADILNPTFRKTHELFAIRQFLKEIPPTLPIIFTVELDAIIQNIFGDNFFVVKSIYFDKTSQSNWFVSYHQDLTISVNKKMVVDGYGPWTVKQNQYAVQPPLNILQKNFTIRIHLDDTDENNGALRVLPASHLKGICRTETIDWSKEREVSCAVPKGGVMFMRPLLLHASSRTTNNKRRRVIHIECSNQKLPEPLQWSELQADFPSA